MSEPELLRLISELFPELLQTPTLDGFRSYAHVPHVQSTSESSSNHLAYDVLNRRFVRSDRGVPIQLPHVPPVNEVRTSAFGSSQGASVPTTTSEEHHIPSMFPRFPVEDRNERRTSRSYPEFDELMQMYHRNVFEYNRTTQTFIGEISSNRSRSSQSIREISNISHSFNQNMQEYHRITDNCLDLLRDMYFSQNSHNRYTGIRSDNRTDLGVESNINSDVNGRTNVQPTTTFASRTNTTTTISPPRTLFSYTLFPYVGTGTPAQGTTGLGQRVVSETPRLLTQQQLLESTEEYTYASDPVQTVVPVCPISLEDFQEGDSITRIRECLHEFKTPNLNRWFLRSSRCPVCRWNLLSPPTTRSNRSRSNSQLIVPHMDLGSTNNTAIVPGGDQPENSRGRSLYEFVDTSGSATTMPTRLQDILADPSLNQLSHRLFSNIFQNMLMNTTDAPPNITNRGSAEDSLNIQSLFGGGAESFINSIDITYTIDYDSSSNATTE